MKRILFSNAGGANALADTGLLILRLFTGLMLAFGHGIFKVRNPQPFIQGVSKMGLPAPTAAAWMAIFAEFVCGILIAIGVFTRPAALIIVINMAVAAFLAHANAPLLMQTAAGGPSKEPALLYMVPALAILLMGAGRYSIDALLVKKSRHRGFNV